jgi:hypothetical protein
LQGNVFVLSGVIRQQGAVPKGATGMAEFTRATQAQDRRREDQASIISILAALQGATETDEMDFLDGTQEKILA